MNAGLDASYWTQRYESGETGWDTGGITTPLKEFFDHLEDKNPAILIPGAGNSYEAEYLLNAGFTNVTVCDLSNVPLQNLRARVGDSGALHLVHSDFFDLTGSYDLIIEQTFFCALDPSLRLKYFQKMAELLKSGGHLVGLLFDDALNNDKPPYGGNKAEYLKYIPAEFRIEKMERCYNSIAPRAGRELFMKLRR